MAASVGCKRGCAEHDTVVVDVDLSVPHGYRDLTPVPVDLAVAFSMYVWDGPGGDGPYCPAVDVVSETIRACGIWEPVETVVALRALQTAAEGQWLVDVGAHIGWYTMLGVASSVPVYAIEGEPANAELLRRSLLLERWRTHPATSVVVRVIDERTGPFTSLAPGRSVRLAKIDIEGAEAHALRVLEPWVAAGLVDLLLVEVTPAWGDYERLVRSLTSRGYALYTLPDKAYPPHVIDGTRASLKPWCVDDDDIAAVLGSRDQQNVLLVREDVEW